MFQVLPIKGSYNIRKNVRHICINSQLWGTNYIYVYLERSDQRRIGCLHDKLEIRLPYLNRMIILDSQIQIDVKPYSLLILTFDLNFFIISAKKIIKEVFKIIINLYGHETIWSLWFFIRCHPYKIFFLCNNYGTSKLH